MVHIEVIQSAATLLSLIATASLSVAFFYCHRKHQEKARTQETVNRELLQQIRDLAGGG